MVTIIRNRILDMKKRGMTLDQVKWLCIEVSARKERCNI